MARSVYLAGPGVFLPDPVDYGEAKKAICLEFKVEGLFPMDNKVKLERLDPMEQGGAISRANEKLMRQCDFAIVDLTPYRGISADPGTCYELGFLRALEKPVFAYSNDGRTFLERAQANYGTAITKDPMGRPQVEGMALEDFGMCDNLMLHAAIRSQGFEIILGDVPEDERYTSLEAFRKTVEFAVEKLFGE